MRTFVSVLSAALIAALLLALAGCGSSGSPPPAGDDPSGDNGGAPPGTLAIVCADIANGTPGACASSATALAFRADYEVTRGTLSRSTYISSVWEMDNQTGTEPDLWFEWVVIPPEVYPDQPFCEPYTQGGGSSSDGWPMGRYPYSGGGGGACAATYAPLGENTWLVNVYSAPFHYVGAGEWLPETDADIRIASGAMTFTLVE